MKKKSKKSAPAKKVSAAKSEPKSSVGLQPLGDRVLVKPAAADEGRTLPSGIIIPDTVDKDRKTERGEVVAVGPGRRGDNGQHIPLDVSVGDRIYYSKSWNDPVKIGGVEYHLIAESDIIGVDTH